MGGVSSDSLPSTLCSVTKGTMSQCKRSEPGTVVSSATSDILIRLRMPIRVIPSRLGEQNNTLEKQSLSFPEKRNRRNITGALIARESMPSRVQPELRSPALVVMVQPDASTSKVSCLRPPTTGILPNGCRQSAIGSAYINR